MPMPPAQLPEATRMAQVHLRTRDLTKALAFYRDVLGLTMREQQGRMVSLSADPSGPAWLVLTEDSKATPHALQFTGLYHLAVRYPARRDLAQALLLLLSNRYPIEGASDHIVSEAIYLSDPDDNGVELYADRPRSQWIWRGGQVEMATNPLDLENLLSTVDDRTATVAPPRATDLGHLHLHVADLSAAERFYHDFLGLSVTQRAYPGALFFSAGGYHHHLAVNTWGGKVNPPANSVGLISYRMEVPEPGVVTELQHRAVAAGYETRGQAESDRQILQIRDPNGSWLEVHAAAE